MDLRHGDAIHVCRHRLYERALQSPERDLALLERIFAEHAGREARTLREDFCGTAQLAARWVESDDEREAVGVDRDPEVLSHAATRELDDDERARLELVETDVRKSRGGPFDLIVAMNMSWALLEDDALLEYLAAARRQLEPDGLLVLELFGGPELRRPRRVEHPHENFTYIWEQKSMRGRVLEVAIHFELSGGERIDDAFAYRFVLRTPAELEAVFEAAGFGSSTLYVEDRLGRYARRRGRPRAPLWRGLFAARGRSSSFSSSRE